MADFTKTVSNSLVLIAQEPPSLWGVMIWGTDKWGNGSNDTPHDVTHLVTPEDLTPTSTLSRFDVVFYKIDDDVTLSSEIIKHFAFAISNELTPTAETTAEYLADAAGYNYVFVDDVTNLDNRSFNTYTSAATASGSYTSLTAGSSTWS